MKPAFALLLLTATTALAHPGVSIVFDSRGNLFYTDLKQVWRIAADGSKSIAVPNVHTHELYIDANDNLYGEHLWYNGERLDTWGSRVWRRSPDGRVVDVVPAHAGFNDYSFVRDRAGNSYFADRARNAIRIRKPNGEAADLARGHFRDIRWMTVTPEGTVYFVDTLDLMRVTPDGRLTTVARNLSEPRSLLRPWAGGRHSVMGLWVDRAGNVYAAVNAEGVVKKIDSRGRITTVSRSNYPWSPTGGTFDRVGNLWLLEYGPGNAVRVRKITARGRTSGLASADR
jgi:streptogramin lyase